MKTSETVAFIGLGIMGSPMAANLVQAGYDVVGYNRSTPAIDRLVSNGGRAADSISAAVIGADLIITMLPDSPDVVAVALGPGGVLESARPGALYVDMSTIRPDVARDVAARGREVGLHVLDAPVSGGELGAIQGTLSIMVGGEASDVTMARAALGELGSAVLHVGPSGSGQTVKAANQLVVAGIIELVSEAIVFLEANNVDTNVAIEALRGGLAGNRVLDRKAETMLNRSFEPGFRAELHHKDLGILLRCARDAGVVLPLGAVVGQLMAALLSRGGGNLDHTALLVLVEELSGRGSTRIV